MDKANSSVLFLFHSNRKQESFLTHFDRMATTSIEQVN